MRILVIVLFISTSLLTSCGNKKTGEGKILSSDKMQAVMWDFIQADAFTEFYLKKDSSKNVSQQPAALQKKIFALHQVTKEDFYTSFNYYSNRSSDMRILLDSISAKAERQRNKMMEKRYAPKPFQLTPKGGKPPQDLQR
jgi:hypothetical protein